MPNEKCPPWDASKGFDGVFVSQLVAAYMDGVSTAKRKMTELSDVKRWHATTFKDHTPTDHDYYAGNFRQVDSARPCLNGVVKVGGISGAAPNQVLVQMESLFADARNSFSIVELKWPTLNLRERAMYLAVIIGELVGRFIQIHPFRDGNGRISRILWAVALTRYGVNPQCRLHPRPGDLTPYAEIMKHCMSGDFKPLQLEILKYLSLIHI